MADNKRYYWLKLDENFFEDDTIAWLEEQENGKDYVIFYLKLALKSLQDEGRLIRYVGETLIPYDVKALAKLTNTPIDTVAIAIKTFVEIGLIARLDTGEIYLNQINEMIGTETRQASLMRRKRAKVNQIKKLAEIEENHIPYIEDYTNRSRYGGNYYNVFNRDEQQCVSCGSKSNLCVHHIIGFDETDNKTTQMGSMITLCRSCHSKEHANPRSIVSDEILGKIGFDFSLYKRIDSLIDTHGRSNNVTESYPDVKKSYTEIEIEKELDIELEKDIDIEKEKKKPKKKKPIIYDPDEKLNQAILDFIDFRKKIRATMTDRAITLMLNKLNKMTNDNDEKIEILEQSIMNGWKSVYPLKNDKKYGKQTFDDFVEVGKEWLSESAGVFDDSSDN